MRINAAGLFSCVAGIAFAVPGVLLALWLAAWLVNTEWASKLAFWAFLYWPFPLATPEKLANDLNHDRWWVFAAIGAAFSLAFARDALLQGRESMREPDESHDGKARIAFKAAHLRVGEPLEGTLRLARDATPDEQFVVELSCRRSTSRNPGTSTMFREEQRAAATRGAHGWSVPFRFNIPVTAPASTARCWWRLDLRSANGWFARRSRFAVVLGAAADEELEALERRDSPEHKQTVAALDAYGQLSGRGKLLPHEREHLRSLSPQELAIAHKVFAMPQKILSAAPQKILKWVLIVSAVVFVAMVVEYFLWAFLISLLP